LVPTPWRVFDGQASLANSLACALAYALIDAFTLVHGLV
jgi:23S rRNA G2445 N2-methylase RlmL